MPSPTPSTLIASPSWAAVLGLVRHDDGWTTVRVAQAGEVARIKPLWLLINLVAAAALAASLRAAAYLELWIWLGGIAAVVALLLAVNRRRPLNGAAAPVGLTAAGAALLGLLWAFPPLLFSGRGNVEQDIALAAIIPGMMAAATLMLAATPLAAMIFVLLVGASGCAMMAQGGSPVLAAVALFYTGCMLVGCLSTGRMAMHRRAVEMALAEKSDVVSLLLGEFDEGGADWLWQVNASKCLINVSAQTARKLGCKPEEIEGKALLQLVAGDAWQDGNFSDGHHRLADRLNARESFSDLELPVVIAGETRWWNLAASPRHDAHGRFVGFWGVGADITEQRRAVEKIDHMARFDTLTGLANRAQVMEVLATAVIESHRQGRRAALMILDLDRFKAVNDTLGHPMGDRLLREVADRLKALCGDGEICGRLGGDEFAIVVGDASNRTRVDRLADKIIAQLSTPFEIDEHRLFIGASVGIATSPIDGRSVEMLVRNADLALYRAKEDGRGVHRRYEQKFHARAEERREIEAALRDALELGQFHLAYQPIVAASDGKIEAFEAFLRWTHPVLGAVAPDRFIPIAEEARLIGRIGEWVIRSACAEAMTWPGDVRLAINLSAAQLHDPDLVPTLVSALAHSGLASHRLELEITEAVFLRQEASTAAVLDRILALGVGVALADFGIGHSSLGYLHAARFSTIKIDRSFVRGAVDNAAASIGIIRAVVAMADSLGMKTTAEGAETNEEYALVRKLGCRQVQGYLFGHPVLAEEARAMIGLKRKRVA